jgi:phage gp46-like protein
MAREIRLVPFVFICPVCKRTSRGFVGDEKQTGSCLWELMTDKCLPKKGEMKNGSSR